MIGWNIGIYRQQDGGEFPATEKSACGSRVAIWQAEVEGMRWIRELVKAGDAIYLGGNGYPYLFTATAEVLIPRIVDKPPMAREFWHRDVVDFVGEGWVGKTAVDLDVSAQCRPGEWLKIEVWDES